ncbi:MAG: hypothetical protein ACOY0T_28795 [Myxococcota bacterium]
MLRKLSALLSLSALITACAAPDTTESSVARESFDVLRTPSPHAASPAVRSLLVRAGNRICDLAADLAGDPAHNGLSDDDPDDGGWDWVLAPSSAEHTVQPSPENLYGAVALAPWAALRGTGSPLRFRATLENVYLGASLNPVVDSPPDFVLLTLMSDTFHRARYAQLARERYDARVAAAGGAGALALEVSAGRQANAADGLVAYDLAWFALAALALSESFPRAGYRDDFAAFTQPVLEDLNSPTPVFDYRNPAEPFYAQGLAWSVLVASWSRASFDLLADLRARLLSLQLDNGAWGYNADAPEAHLQATAHALMALALIPRGYQRPHSAMHAASAWLMAQQAENGGWVYASEEYPLLDAEIALAIYLAETPHGSHRGLTPTGSVRAALSEPGAPARAPLSAPEP